MPAGATGPSAATVSSALTRLDLHDGITLQIGNTYYLYCDAADGSQLWGGGPTKPAI
jgi:hypothetical protein